LHSENARTDSVWFFSGQAGKTIPPRARGDV